MVSCSNSAGDRRPRSRRTHGEHGKMHLEEHGTINDTYTHAMSVRLEQRRGSSDGHGFCCFFFLSLTKRIQGTNKRGKLLTHVHRAPGNAVGSCPCVRVWRCESVVSPCTTSLCVCGEIPYLTLPHAQRPHRG